MATEGYKNLNQSYLYESSGGKINVYMYSYIDNETNRLILNHIKLRFKLAYNDTTAKLYENKEILNDCQWDNHQPKLK